MSEKRNENANNQKSGRRRRWLLIPAALILAAVIALGFLGNYLVNFALLRSEEHDVAPEAITEEDRPVFEANKAALEAMTDAWLAEASCEEISLASDDGLTLRADLFVTDETSHDWLIGVHGYTGSREDYRTTAAVYAGKGYNILLPDMRAHGESDGTYRGMGWLDRRDILLWIDEVISRDPEAAIILHGTSMGGATVMMTAGETLPANVKGIVEDCGYTSVWDIFEDELAYLFHLPAHPVLDAADIVCRLKAGYGFREASALEQIRKAAVPILFIHGDRDNFVMTDMVYELYEACPTAKAILVVEGAGHGEANKMDPEAYYSTVFDFIEENCR